MTVPLLSICIPTFNRQEILTETLTHLAQVCSEDVEVVVSDNCSPDRTQDVVDSFGGKFRHFRAIRQSENRGPVLNFAAAMSFATGKYLYPLSDDDRVHFGGLWNAVSIMESNPEICGVFGGYQEWNRTTGQITTQALVSERINFTRGSKGEICSRFNLLWHPVCRAETYHRYHGPDARTFGEWGLVASLLEHGDISIIPDLFYQHAQSEPRLEYQLTEGWYQDAHRAGYECFVGRMGPAEQPAKLAEFVMGRTTPAYVQATRFAKVKQDWLAARHFFLRARAYGLASEEQVRAFETDNLVGMLTQRLVEKLSLLPGINEIVFDASPRLLVLRGSCAAIAPQYSVSELGQEKLRQNQCLITFHYKRLESGELRSDPAVWVAVEDLIESCRLTDLPLAPAPPRRNELCPCGSELRYKYCHGRFD